MSVVSKMFGKKLVLCDLDGVVWLAHRPIAGSVEALERLRTAGVEVLFVTNNSFSTRGQQHEALARIGIDAHGKVVTSAMAAARLVREGERVLVCGGEGLIEEVTARGAEVVVPYRERASGSFDSVVVGFHREFSFDVLSVALTAVRGGARLIGSNSDRTYPTADGPIPGGGSILAAVEHATGVSAVVTGKPHAPMAALVREWTGVVGGDGVLMVGDLPETDGAFARTMGCDFALVMSGMTSRHDGAGVEHIGADLAEVVDRLLSTT